MKKAKNYVRKGDGGNTMLNGAVVEKTHQRIQAIGSLEELSSILGIMHGMNHHSTTGKKWLEKNGRIYREIQEDLLIIGTSVSGKEVVGIDKDRIAYIEEMIAELQSKLISLEHFILPGGCEEASWLYLARSVCRRAERDLVTVHVMKGGVESDMLVYMNRLSDLFFIMARHVNSGADVLFRKENVLKGS